MNDVNNTKAAARITSTPPIAAGADAGLSEEELAVLERQARVERFGIYDDVRGDIIQVVVDQEYLFRLIAAARSTASPAQVEALRSALRPFAQAAEGAEGLPEDTAVAFYPCTVADLRRARAALAEPLEDFYEQAALLDGTP